MAEDQTGGVVQVPAPAPEVPVTPVIPEEHPTIVTRNAVEDAATASDVADVEHVAANVAATHSITTSLLHHTSQYVKIVEGGVTRFEQIV